MKDKKQMDAVEAQASPSIPAEAPHAPPPPNPKISLTEWALGSGLDNLALRAMQTRYGQQERRTASDWMRRYEELMTEPA